MLGLGVDKEWRSGGITQSTKSNMESVQEAIDWVMPVE